MKKEGVGKYHIPVDFNQKRQWVEHLGNVLFEQKELT